jgi:UDP-N-acetyl-L-fucosamine synthase
VKNQPCLIFPAVTLRSSMERPEALDAGTIVLTGFDEDVVLESVKLVVKEHTIKPYSQIPLEYSVDNTSWRVLKLILGTSRLSNQWHGITINPYIAKFILNSVFPRIKGK